MIIHSVRPHAVVLGLVYCMVGKCISLTPSSSTRTSYKLLKCQQTFRQPEPCCLVALKGAKLQDISDLHPEGRRGALRLIVGSALGFLGGLVRPSTALAEGQVLVVDEPAASPLPQVEMKEFVDPKGLFSIRIPKTFFAIRREVKGDLPDPKTGEGRRGSSIFTAGDMSKAELVAIERCVSAENARALSDNDLLTNTFLHFEGSRLAASSKKTVSRRQGTCRPSRALASPLRLLACSARGVIGTGRADEVA
jgi:hypothetical protein